MPTLDSMRGELAFSSRIAAALLAVLAESGDVSARSRALRALGGQGVAVRGRGRWIGGAELAAMMRTAGVDARMARRVGQALVRPDGVGFALCYGGLATTEKAYRRVHHLLARESEGARYEPRQIDGERGRIRFHPPEGDDDDRVPDEVGLLMCAMRRGMLEAVPLLFGLVPATVHEKRCAYAGGPHCEFEVRWSRGPRTGLAAGALLGTAAGAGVLAGSSALGWPLWAAVVAAPALAVLAAAAGRSIDLARQLEAVAGARRGHLALLDQLDDALAERMDTLAKLGGSPEAHRRTTAPDPHEPTGLVPVEWAGAAGAAGAEALPAGGMALGDPDTGEEPSPTDLRALIVRTAGALDDAAGAGQGVELDLGESDVVVPCRAEQIAFVVDQLVRNAIAAQVGEGDPGAASESVATPLPVRVSLRETPSGVEVSVEDAGPGLEADVVDRVFDPFAEPGPAGRSGGLGLPVCLRIVEGHGGELRVQPGAERGTRVSFVLPA